MDDFEGMEHEQVEALNSIASALRYLGNGNAGTQMGAIENLAIEVKEGTTRIASALELIAEAIDRVPNV